ncbi:MAG: hypothetical protein RIQ62_636 [Bacteroidota bacterium]
MGANVGQILHIQQAFIISTNPIIFGIVQHPLLEVKNLSIHFQMNDSRVMAVQDLSYTLYPGKTLAVVGESGSGKSVSALCIPGLLPEYPYCEKKGEIWLWLSDTERINLLQCSKEQLVALRGSRVGIIFQEPMSSLNPLMTCGEQVSEVIRQHKKANRQSAREQSLRLFTEVRLPEPERLYEKYPHEISGGQKQRVMIAMAMACEPLLLIADEPTTALDVSVQHTILDLLNELREKRGIGILFITHDLSLVQHFADDVLVMWKGKMIETAPTQTLFSSPQAAYTKSLLLCKPKSQQRVKFLRTLQQDKEDDATKDNLISISTQDFVQEAGALLLKHEILRCEEVQIWYPQSKNILRKPTQWHKAVQGVNLCIHKGETVGLLGESGCGKTSLGKAIVGLHPIQSGCIYYQQKSLVDMSRSEKRDYQREVQMIFQDPYGSLNPRIAIGEAIREPMEVHGLLTAKQRKEKTIELLQKVGLQPEHYHRYPHEFSGGQRQRICIARTLALQPKVILCDESVSALDISIQAQILNLLVVLREEFALSYLFISHDLQVVRHISNQVAVMQNGKIIEIQDAESLYQKPQKEYTQQFIESSFSLSTNIDS